LDSRDALSLLSEFRNQRVLVVGDVMLDRYLWGAVARLSPEAPVPIVAKQRTSALPGGAANVAVNVAALGGHPVLVSAAGAGPEAKELQAALVERGVIDEVIFNSGRKTTVKTRIIAHSQQLLRVDEEETDPIDSSLAEELLDRIDRVLPSVQAVILSDYAKGLLTGALLAGIMVRTRRVGLPVLVDPKGRDYARYNGASLITPNRSEAFLAAGLSPDSGDRVVDVGRRLLDSLAIDALLITEGESGMTLMEKRGSPVHVPAAARAVYDVTGAGDTVIATIALALGAGGSLRTAAYLANLAGGLAVEQVGTATVTAAALASILQDQRHPLPSFSEIRIDDRIQ